MTREVVTTMSHTMSLWYALDTAKSLALLPNLWFLQQDKKTVVHDGRLPFDLESDLEVQICADPAWRKGAYWGRPRPGHREGAVMHHIVDVLKNVDRQTTDHKERCRLRIIALIHDTFKYQSPKNVGVKMGPHHGMIARKFAELYITDPIILDVLELHDDVYHYWRLGARMHMWGRTIPLTEDLVRKLQVRGLLRTYIQFFRCDIQTESKSQEPLHWFETFLTERGYEVPAEVVPFTRPVTKLPVRIWRWLMRKLMPWTRTP